MLGVPVNEIDRTVRMAIAGLNIGTFRKENGDEYNINVTLPRQERQTFDAFGKVYVSSQNGSSIPLSQLADVRFQTSPTSIKHYDKDRYAVATAFVKNGYNTGKVTTELLKKLDTLQFPAGAYYKPAGEVEASKESFGGLGTIVLITIFGILGTLILEFKTFRSTMIVLSVIPLGIIGAVLMLL